MFDIVGRRRWYFALSLLVTIPGLIFILLTPLSGGQDGLKFSNDYTGGTIWEVHFKDGTPTTTAVREVLAGQGLADSTVAITQGPLGSYVRMRMEPIGLATPAPVETPVPTLAITPSPSASASPAASSSPSASSSPIASASPAASASPSPTASPSASPSPSPSASPSPSPSPTASPSPTPAATGYQPPTQGKLGALAAALQARFGPIDGELQQSSVGPIVSQDLATDTLLLIIFGSLGILTWITIRFRDVRMGACALAALLHDVVVVVGTFAILGTFFGVEIDALFVTALLTVIGFSVHDTIVVFDRIRENKVRHAGEPFSAIVNHSLLQTLGRSLNTSLTVIITLSALLLFGGEPIRVFVLALLLGIISGTYSSIFNASQLLVAWHEYDDRKRQQEFIAARAR
ncbi:MAG TPA: protein translocase subunit SecF [Candidatus Limnocylindrales bacterium]|nr:protein translocase subunit SecF [Candidatus Limnocylindrales bacterium]